ncbi:hypothetical protein ABTZ03_32495, partial [Kitasatospora sp. NPDC096077]
MLSVVTAEGSTESGSLIDEIVREGARRMPAAALEAEVNRYMADLAAETDGSGRRLVVRNGHHRPRRVVTAAGPVEVTAPRVTGRPVAGHRHPADEAVGPGPGSPAAALAMVFELVASARTRRRAITGAHLVA